MPRPLENDGRRSVAAPLRPGRRRRLRERFSDFDRARNRLVWPMAAIMAVPPVVVLAALRFFPSPPDWLTLTSLFGSGIASFLAGAYWARRRCDRLAVELDLLCSRCGRPLARAALLVRPGSPSYREPFAVPRRCPSCRLSIDEAARPVDDS